MRKYPYIVDKQVFSLSKEEKNVLINDSVGVLSTRVELTVLNSTDTIILSSILGSVISGLYSNYSLIVSTISTLAGMVFSSFQASIGNYCVQKEETEARGLYSNIGYVYYCIYGAATICLIGLLTPTISIWLGKDYILAKEIPWIISINFYISNSRQANLQFITVYHLLPKLNAKNIVEALINIIISIILVRKIGLIGIFIGTAISLLSTSTWYEPFVLYKNKWGSGIGTYFIKYFLRFFVVISFSVLASSINIRIFTGNITSLVCCFFLTIILGGIAVTLPYMRTKEFAFVVSSLRSLTKNKLGGSRK